MILLSQQTQVLLLPLASQAERWAQLEKLNAALFDMLHANDAVSFYGYKKDYTELLQWFTERRIEITRNHLGYRLV